MSPELSSHVPTASSFGFPTLVPTPPLATCTPTSAATFFVGFPSGNTSSSVGPSVNTSLAMNALSSMSASRAEIVIVTEEVRVVSQILPRASPGSSIAIALPLNEQEAILQAAGNHPLAKVVSDTSSRCEQLSAPNLALDGVGHSSGLDSCKEATIQPAVITSSLLLITRNSSKIKLHRRRSLFKASRILPSQLASLPSDAMLTHFQESNDLQKRNSFAPIQCDIDALEAAIHRYRNELLSCGDYAGSAKVAKFDRDWCLDSSTGLFVDCKVGANKLADNNRSAHSQSQHESNCPKQLGHHLEEENEVLLETGLADKTIRQLDACSASPDSSLASMFIQDLFSDVESSSEGSADKQHSQLDACSASSSSSSDSICRRKHFSDDMKSSSNEDDLG
eukprot:gene23571-28581_t